MKSKIATAFENCKKEKRSALITYTVAGDNTKNNSLKILNTIAKHADILELGFPHNTPIADGGQIQGSSHRALKNGIKLKNVFQIVKKFKKLQLPLELKKRKSDFIIKNNFKDNLVKKNVKSLLNKIL